ncbi:hypothetical protein BVRB_024190, partial [Beta vulgaris subsp. vulgaris]
KRRLLPSTDDCPINIPGQKTRLVMQRLTDYIVQCGIWFEAAVQERHVQGDHLSFLEPDNPYHSFYLKLKRNAVLAAASATRVSQDQ